MTKLTTQQIIKRNERVKANNTFYQVNKGYSEKAMANQDHFENHIESIRTRLKRDNIGSQGLFSRIISLVLG